jgi:hypothetical protein
MANWHPLSPTGRRISRVLEFAAASAHGVLLVSVAHGIAASRGETVELRAVLAAEWDSVRLAHGRVTALSDELIIAPIGDTHLLLVQVKDLRATDPAVLLRVRRTGEVLGRLLRSLRWPAQFPPTPSSAPSGAPAEARVFAPSRPKGRPS